MRIQLVSILLLLPLISAANPPLTTEGRPAAVPSTERGQWWSWTNPPAVPPEAGSLFLSAQPQEVELAYTITSDGTVSDCRVARKLQPELDDRLLCRLVETHVYEPAKANAIRQAIRTSFVAFIGPPGSEPPPEPTRSRKPDPQ